MRLSSTTRTVPSEPSGFGSTYRNNSRGLPDPPKYSTGTSVSVSLPNRKESAGVPPAVNTDTGALYCRNTSIDSKYPSESSATGFTVTVGAVSGATAGMSDGSDVVQRTPTASLGLQLCTPTVRFPVPGE